MFKLAAFFIFSTLLFFLSNVECESFYPQNGSFFYPLRLPDQGKFGFSFNLKAEPLHTNWRSIKFIVGSQPKPCVIDIKIQSLFADSKFIISLKNGYRSLYGDAPQIMPQNIEFKLGKKALIEVIYYKDILTFDDIDVRMKCSVKAVTMDDGSNSLDVLVVMNGFWANPEFSIDWLPTISYYGKNRPQPYMGASTPTPDPLPEPESQSIFLPIVCSVFGLIVGLFIGFLSVAGYLLCKKNYHKYKAAAANTKKLEQQTTLQNDDQNKKDVTSDM